MSEKTSLMDTISQGVYVIGTKMGDTYNLMTAAWITQVSFSPCRIALAVDVSHYTADLIKEQGCFTLSVLAKGQEEIARLCGFESGRDTDKSKRVAYKLTEQGLPIIDDVAAYMACKVTQILDVGDHLLFVAEIVKGEIIGNDTLPYVSATYF